MVEVGLRAELCPGYRTVASSRRISLLVRLSYIASGLLLGKSTRPQAPMNRVSPEISRCCTRKHCEPGVWPGVCNSVIWTSPLSPITWLLSVGTLEDAGTFLRMCVSVLCTYTGT